MLYHQTEQLDTIKAMKEAEEEEIKTRGNELDKFVRG